MWTGRAAPGDFSALWSTSTDRSQGDFELSDLSTFVSVGTDHDPLHRVPGSHLLQLLHLPQREGQRGAAGAEELQQLRRRPVVGGGELPSQFCDLHKFINFMNPRLDSAS